jgi:hypothetical protein
MRLASLLMTCRSWCIRSLMCKYQAEARTNFCYLFVVLWEKLACSQVIFWDLISGTKGAQQPYQLVSYLGIFILRLKLVPPPVALCIIYSYPWGLISLFCLSAVAPICYAHLAAAQVGQFVKFDEMSETSSSHGKHTSAGSVPVQELPRLHEKVRSSMFFCWVGHVPWFYFLVDGWVWTLSCVRWR